MECIRFEVESTRSSISLLTAMMLATILWLTFLNPVSADSHKFKYVGVGSCSSSNCHGSVSPKSGSRIGQNEYIIWQKQDLHARAYNSLLSEDGKRMGDLLGIKAPHKEKLCLDCHATNPPDELRAASFHIEDGVGCESCHGAAEGYLETHAVLGNSRGKSVENGLKDIVAPTTRAKLCLSCHIGDDSKMVTHRLIGAGHPRLSFELDTFSMIQPKHWVMDTDYRKEKGAYDSGTVWLIGQIANARRLIDLLMKNPLAREGAWPELSLLYCFSCHHNLGEKQWQRHDYEGHPGVLRLNTASLKIASEAIAPFQPGLSKKLAKLTEELHLRKESSALISIAKQTDELLEQAEHATMAVKLTDEWLKQLFGRLTEIGANSRFPQYEFAEQIAMGLQSVSSAIDSTGGYYKGDIERIYQSLNSTDGYRPEMFVSACKDLMGRVKE